MPCFDQNSLVIHFTFWRTIIRYQLISNLRSLELFNSESYGKALKEVDLRVTPAIIAFKAVALSFKSKFYDECDIPFRENCINFSWVKEC